MLGWCFMYSSYSPASLNPKVPNSPTLSVVLPPESPDDPPELPHPAASRLIASAAPIAVLRLETDIGPSCVPAEAPSALWGAAGVRTLSRSDGAQSGLAHTMLSRDSWKRFHTAMVRRVIASARGGSVPPGGSGGRA